MTERLYACNCPTSPRPKSDYREIDVGKWVDGQWQKSGKTVLVCGWCKSEVKPVKKATKKSRRPPHEH